MSNLPHHVTTNATSAEYQLDRLIGHYLTAGKNIDPILWETGKSRQDSYRDIVIWHLREMELMPRAADKYAKADAAQRTLSKIQARSDDGIDGYEKSWDEVFWSIGLIAMRELREAATALEKEAALEIASRAFVRCKSSPAGEPAMVTALKFHHTSYEKIIDEIGGQHIKEMHAAKSAAFMYRSFKAAVSFLKNKNFKPRPLSTEQCLLQYDLTEKNVLTFIGFCFLDEAQTEPTTEGKENKITFAFSLLDRAYGVDFLLPVYQAKATRSSIFWPLAVNVAHEIETAKTNELRLQKQTTLTRLLKKGGIVPQDFYDVMGFTGKDLTGCVNNGFMPRREDPPAPTGFVLRRHPWPMPRQ